MRPSLLIRPSRVSVRAVLPLRVPVLAGSHHGPSFRDCAESGAAIAVATARPSANVIRFIVGISYDPGKILLSFLFLDFSFFVFSFSRFGESPKIT